MTYLYLASFLVGLLLAVRVMMYGVERPREHDPSGERTFRLSPAVAVASAIVFGVLGYALSRFRPGASGSNFVVAAVLGAVAGVITARLVRQWWAVTPEHDVDDERYVLQGQVAEVTKPIRSDVDGEVAFKFGDEVRVLRARGLDAVALDAGTEVVIERIEGDVAYVEAWAEVEKRL